MNKREMKTASDGDLIVEYVLTVAEEMTNFNLGRGWQRLGLHRLNIEEEIRKRGILTDRQIRRVNFEN